MKQTALLLCLLASLLPAQLAIRASAGSVIGNRVREPSPFVPGLSTHATLRIYLTTDDHDLQGICLLLWRPANLTITKVEYNEEICRVAPVAPPLDASCLPLRVDAGPGAVAIAAAPGEQLFCTIHYTIADLQGERDLPLRRINSATGLKDGTTRTYALDRTGVNQATYTATSLSVVPAFRCTPVPAADLSLPEDTTLALSLADSTRFQCQAWDADRGGYAPVSDAAFLAARIADAGEAYDATIVGAQLLYTPPAYWNGTAHVEYTAAWHGIPITGAFDLTVTPVDNPPQLAAGPVQLTLVEGQPIAGTLQFTAIDHDGGESIAEATITLTALDGTVFTATGTLAKDDTVNGEDGFPTTRYTLTIDGAALPYTAVRHPATNAPYVLTLHVHEDGPDACETALPVATAQIADTDQPPRILAWNLNGHQEDFALTAADSLNGTATGTDPDPEDTPAAFLQYSRDDGATWSDTPPSPLVKHTPLLARPVVSANGLTATGDAIAVTIENTPPTLLTPPPHIVIVRPDARNGSTVFTAQDLDGWNDLRLANADGTPADTFAGTILGGCATATISGDGSTATITLAYTLPPECDDTADRSDELRLLLTDADHATPTPVSIPVLYLANPPPTLTFSETAPGSIPETDSHGQPTSFTIAVHAEDRIVHPAGVSAWNAQVLQADGTPAHGWIIETLHADTGSTANDWQGYARFRITTPGYETIHGDGRSAQAGFRLRITADDATLPANIGTVEHSFTVTDCDRPPTAPTIIQFTPANPHRNDTLVAAADGAIDPDGDRIEYQYAWSVSTDGGASFADVGSGDTAPAALLRKGNHLRCTAFARTAPYGTTADSTPFTAEVTVGNCPPILTTLGDAATTPGAAAPLAFTWELAEDCGPVTIPVQAMDPDGDAITLAVGTLSHPEAGILAIDPASGLIAFTPAPDYNTTETGDTLTFTVHATDADGATAANSAIVTIRIHEVNDRPAIAIANQFHALNTLGNEQTLTVPVNLGAATETTQVITDVNLEILDGASLFAAAPTATIEDGSLLLTYTLRDDAVSGNAATIRLAVTDNGTTNGTPDPLTSEECTFQIIVGTTPWYPTIPFTCTGNHKNHIVSLEDQDGNAHTLVIEGTRTTILPSDYYDSGHPGYLPGTTVQATIYSWTLAGGRGQLCTTAQTTIPEYGIPGTPTATTDTPTLLNTGWHIFPDIIVPLAASCTILLRNNETGHIGTHGPIDFRPESTPGDIPAILQQQHFRLIPGDYTVLLQGHNPVGDGPAQELFHILQTAPPEGGIAWADEGFRPAANTVRRTLSVRFSWPIALGAQDYTLRVTQIEPENNAGTVITRTGIQGNAKTLELAVDGNHYARYSWQVIAEGAGATLASPAKDLYIIRRNSTLRITGFTAADDRLRVSYEGTIGPNAVVKYEYQYYSQRTSSWTNGTLSKTGPHTLLDFGVRPRSGDYLYLTVYLDGTALNNQSLYLIP